VEDFLILCRGSGLRKDDTRNETSRKVYAKAGLGSQSMYKKYDTRVRPQISSQVLTDNHHSSCPNISVEQELDQAVCKFGLLDTIGHHRAVSYRY
jgi:hypothetical protein